MINLGKERSRKRSSRKMVQQAVVMKTKKRKMTTGKKEMVVPNIKIGSEKLKSVKLNFNLVDIFNHIRLMLHKL